ncbi:hypothetical protein [Shewanella algae]|uniref:hypothetical protein n=1 Tax=Shewanella algae TaxID=38313 RepID=UPI0031F4823E
MDGNNLKDEMLIRQVKSAIAGHDFKRARKVLEHYLYEETGTPRIWEFYGNVLKKLGKLDKARDAFLRRDELRRDDFVFEPIADEYIDVTDLDYLDSQQVNYTHEQYVYGMEEQSAPTVKREHYEQITEQPPTSSVPANNVLISQELDSSEVVSPHSGEQQVEDDVQDEISTVAEVVVDDSAEITPNSVVNDVITTDTFSEVTGLSDIYDAEIDPAAELLLDEVIGLNDTYFIDPDDLIENEVESAVVYSEDQITIEQRAVQLAAAFIARHNWPISTLDLLTHIFSVKSYGAVVKFLNFYADAGMQPDVLRAAKFLRDAWHQLSKYWINFYRNGDSDASYSNFSWAQSLRFVTIISQCQNGLSDDDVLLENLDSIYDRWFNSPSLRRSYRAFAKYLNATLDQLEKNDVLYEYEAGFGSMSTARELNFSDIGDVDFDDQELIRELELYGYSIERSEFRSMRFCQDVIYDYEYYQLNRN